MARIDELIGEAYEISNAEGRLDEKGSQVYYDIYCAMCALRRYIAEDERYPDNLGYCSELEELFLDGTD